MIALGFVSRLLGPFLVPLLLSVSVVAGVSAAVQTYRLNAERMAHSQSREQHALRLAAASRAAADEALAAAQETERRVVEIQEIADEAQTQLDQARRDADTARGAAERLRHRAAALAAAARCPTAADPAPALAGPAATAPADLLADVLGRVEQAGRELAAVSDARGAAGTACERAYDALTRPAPDG